jgi:hypothetical protein
LQCCVEVRADLVERGREHRELPVQPLSHRDPLRTLTREQEREPPADRAGGDLLTVDQHRAVVELRARGGERVADVQRVTVHLGHAVDLVAQRVLGLRGHEPRHDRQPGARRHRGCRWRLLDDDVRVRAADAERRDAGTPRVAVRLPRLGFRQQPHVAGVPVDLG